MFSFYSSVCNLLSPKTNPIKNVQKPPYIKMCENDYIISKNEANETIILEVPKKPKFTYF
jgi:hypothetical protein